MKFYYSLNHTQKKWFLFLILLISFTDSSSGQIKHSDTGIYTGQKDKTPFFQKYALSYLSLDIGFSQPNFYNDEFLNNINEGHISNTNALGWGVSLKIETLSAFILDLNFTQIRYKSELIENDILFDDFGLDLSYNLLRSKHFKPYIGAGYKFSKLSANHNATDTSQAIWKVGFIFSPIRFGDVFKLFLIGEYKQPFNITTPQAYNQLTFGIGISINNYGYLY